nr:headcase protein [Hymenolepis microstoma]
MESLEAADSSWFNFDPNASSSVTTTANSVAAESSKMINKKDDSNNSGSKKCRRFTDARQRSGSMAAGNISTIAQNNQQKNVQRRMSFSVPMLGTGTCQFNAKGNIFRQRKDFSVFERLQAWKRNGYFIQLEDDSCTGNEDTRAFVLCQLTGHGASEVSCLACGRPLPIYDHFPLLDGALFLSPVCHRGGLQVSWNVPTPTSSIGSSSSASGGHIMQNDLAPPPGCTGPRQQQVQQQSHHHGFRAHNQGRHRASFSQKRFLHAVCMSCTRSIDPERNNPEGSIDTLSQIVCKSCKSPWNGSTLLIGGLYTYDLFACSPCCMDHLSCKSCGLQPLSPRSELDKNEDDNESVNKLRPLPYFSQYSQLLCCQHCRAVDYHFTKPFDELYEVRINSFQ